MMNATPKPARVYHPNALLALLGDRGVLTQEELDNHGGLPYFRACLPLFIAFASNTSLMSLEIATHDFSSHMLFATAEALKRNASLRKLKMVFSMATTDDVGVAIAEALVQNATLQECHVNFDESTVGDVTGVALAAVIKHNATLKGYCIAYGAGTTDESGLAMAEGLKHNATLQFFSVLMSFSGFSGLTGVAMAGALEQNATLKKFEVFFHGDHEEEDSSGVAIAAALMQNTTLEECAVYVGWWGDEVGLAMAEALRINAALQTYTMTWGSYMSDDTGVAMAAALTQNTTLQKYAMDSGYGMGDRTWMAMAEALKQNATLQALSITGCDDNPCEHETYVAMADAIKQNTTLKYFSVDCTCVDKEFALVQAVAQAREHNVTLQAFSTFLLAHAPALWPPITDMLDMLQRNQEISAQWRSLVQLAKPKMNTGFHSLVELCFKRKLFSFFLPASCVWHPFADSRAVATPEVGPAQAVKD